MPAVDTLSVLETALIAIVLGIAFGIVVIYQGVLQKKAVQSHGGPGGSTIFERITFAGLGLAVLFLSIVVSKHLTALGGHNFIFVFFAAAAGTWITAYLRKRIGRRR